jgi:hypothetical protein
MQVLRNKTTNEEYPITGSIGVPREIDENTFEVWMHFSVDLGEGRVDTIEVHPESTEFEVVDIPDPEPEVEEVPVVEPQPDPVIEPPTAEELARNAWLEQWRIYEKANRAMKALAEAGFEPTEDETTQFEALKQWVGTNRKPEYSQYI